MAASALGLAPWIFGGWVIGGLVIALLLVNWAFREDRDEDIDREDDSWQWPN